MNSKIGDPKPQACHGNLASNPCGRRRTRRSLSHPGRRLLPKQRRLANRAQGSGLGSDLALRFSAEGRVRVLSFGGFELGACSGEDKKKNNPAETIVDIVPRIGTLLRTRYLGSGG